MFRAITAVLLLSLTALAQKNLHPRDGEIKDPDTRSWWHYTEALSGDDMEGRDVGSAGYDRAAKLVADHFKAAGLKPAGDNGTYFQEVPMYETEVYGTGTLFTITRDDGDSSTLDFLHNITIRASEDLPASFEGRIVFAGYCAPKHSGATLPDVKDKVVLCFGTHDGKLVNAAQRTQALREGGARAVIIADDPGYTLEPARWPVPYARTVTTTDPKTVNRVAGIPSMSIDPLTFGTLLTMAGKNAQSTFDKGSHGQPLESFDIPATLHAKLNIKTKTYSSKNVLAIREGDDAKLKDEYVVVSAHLDGYGYGEPVNGDNLYNGALDDAAYVALLMQLADRERARTLIHPPRGDEPVKPEDEPHIFDRSILFCVFTGEEKGLLGSRWYTQHLTVPKDKIVAVINLDQLRPLFPLNILTTLALDKSTLAEDVKAVAEPMQIEVRADMEPERNLLMRTDHWPFMEIGIPAVSFVFGYDKGTDAEKKYREWYQTRYHRPQDDLTQPVDFDAATKFNQFFYRLVAKVANDEKKPDWIR